MLSKAGTLKGYRLHSLDGEIGKVDEFYFDDRHWTIRYLVADTGNWLTGRQVLISPHALANVNSDEQNIVVKLTRKQIEDSPSLESGKPVSHQFEVDYHGYYGWPTYWGGPSMSGSDPSMVRDPNEWSGSTHPHKEWNHHLRHTHEMSGYHIQAEDGEIGHVEDFVIDDETWIIRYLLIDTRNWWPGKKVLVSPRWIEDVSWIDSIIFINLSREAIQRSPEYTDGAPLTREYETGLHRHYNRQGYWVDEEADSEHSR